MPTINQLIKDPRKKAIKPKSYKSLEECPQKRGVVQQVKNKTPKKPNSAIRKCVKVKLSNGREVYAYIPGEGHNLQEHNTVLIKGGKTADLPGVGYKVVRGALDTSGVDKRTTSRSKYGAKKRKNK